MGWLWLLARNLVDFWLMASGLNVWSIFVGGVGLWLLRVADYLMLDVLGGRFFYVGGVFLMGWGDVEAIRSLGFLLFLLLIEL